MNLRSAWGRLPADHRTASTHDLRAGLALGLVSAPDGLTSGLLAGLNPLTGLYGYLFGTLGGALATLGVLTGLLMLAAGIARLGTPRAMDSVPTGCSRAPTPALTTRAGVDRLVVRRASDVMRHRGDS